MEAEVGGEFAIFLQVIEQTLLERFDLLMALEQGRINLTHRDKDQVLELLAKQARQRDYGRQSQTVEAVDQHDGSGGIAVEFVLFLVSGGKQLRDQIHL